MRASTAFVVLGLSWAVGCGSGGAGSTPDAAVDAAADAAPDVAVDATADVPTPGDASADTGGTDAVDPSVCEPSIIGDPATDCPTEPHTTPLAECPVYEGPMGEGGELNFHRVVVDDAVARGAVCNDGCPFVYYVRPARAGGEGKWVLYFMGGGSCLSLADCTLRWMHERSKMKPMGDTREPDNDGILDPTVAASPWSTWNHVFLKYCSSDVHIGDKEASEATCGWHFRGRRIIEAVIEDLAAPSSGPIPSLSDATDVLLFGSSAGGYGSILNADHIAASLPGARVVAVNDAGGDPELGPPAFRTLARVAGACRMTSLWGARPDDSCVAEAEDPNRCADPFYVAAEHLSVPSFLFKDQFDFMMHQGKRIRSLCAKKECAADADCGEGSTCFQGLCLGPTCTSIADCAEGYCNDAGLCYAAQCATDADCEAGATCLNLDCMPDDTTCVRRGFCGRVPGTCATDDDCPADAFCERGACARSVECRRDADCRDGERCVEDVAKCYEVVGCQGSCDCEQDEVCVPAWLTPYSQRLAEDIRGAVEASEAGFSTRESFHVIGNQAEFYTHDVDGATFAELLGAWYFGVAGPTKKVEEPARTLPPDPGPPQCE